MDFVPVTPTGLLVSVMAVVLVVAVIAVLVVPGLRARTWLVWTVLGLAVAAALGALAWTYAI